MELSQLQGQVGRWIEEHGGYWPPQANFARLVEEIGEVARHLNAREGRKALAPDAEPLAGELGDVLFVLAALANQLGLDLDEAARHALRKVAGRAGTPGGAPSGAEK